MLFYSDDDYAEFSAPELPSLSFALFPIYFRSQISRFGIKLLI